MLRNLDINISNQFLSLIWFSRILVTVKYQNNYYFFFSIIKILNCLISSNKNIIKQYYFNLNPICDNSDKDSLVNQPIMHVFSSKAIM